MKMKTRKKKRRQKRKRKSKKRRDKQQKKERRNKRTVNRLKIGGFKVKKKNKEEISCKTNIVNQGRKEGIHSKRKTKFIKR